jgi:hypothetical protein
VRTLPHGHHRHNYGGRDYYYYNGIYYLPVPTGYSIITAPIGFSLATLPVGFLTYYYNGIPYYYYMGTYYVWSDAASVYQVVEAPEEIKIQVKIDEAKAEEEELADSSSSQQARDRYECHSWAVSESGFDPSADVQPSDDNQTLRYNDSLRACLEARGYTVGTE